MLVQSQPHHVLTGLWASPSTPLCPLLVSGVIASPMGGCDEDGVDPCEVAPEGSLLRQPDSAEPP